MLCESGSLGRLMVSLPSIGQSKRPTLEDTQYSHKDVIFQNIVQQSSIVQRDYMMSSSSLSLSAMHLRSKCTILEIA
jgi:hypothetical protein